MFVLSFLASFVRQCQASIAQPMWFFWARALRHWHFSRPSICLPSRWLLYFPADSTHILYGDGGVLGKVVGGDVFRAVCRRNPEQLHLVIHWESVDFDGLATQHFVAEPAQVGNGLVGVCALAVIDFPVGFKRAIKYLSSFIDVHHQILGGVPRIHQHGAKRQVFGLSGFVEHVPHMVEFGLAVALGVIDPPIDYPILVSI